MRNSDKNSNPEHILRSARTATTRMASLASTDTNGHMSSIHVRDLWKNDKKVLAQEVVVVYQEEEKEKTLEEPFPEDLLASSGNSSGRSVGNNLTHAKAHLIIKTTFKSHEEASLES